MDERRARPGKAKRTLKQRAVAMLARREYSRAELAGRLAGAGGSKDEVDAVLDELARVGYLCDARFAGALVRQKSGSHAKRAIAHELRERGVAREAASAALAELAGVDEFAQAQALWERRFGSPPRDEREKARQLRFLLSRGYAVSIAYRVVKPVGSRVDDD